MKKILLSAALMALPLVMAAQSGTNSPYSQFGFGQLSDLSNGFNRGMNGLFQGFRDGNQINHQNPASYSALDSLTFIFDMGVSGQIVNFSENGRKKNAKNAEFEYAVGAFRLFRNLGVSFGIMPYTNVGYDYTLKNSINSDASTSNTVSYTGSGGLHQVFLGAGWSPFKNFGVGFNAAYLWGDINRYVVSSYTDTYMNSLTKHASMSVTSYLLDFGLQYKLDLNKQDALTFGLTYGLGHNIGGNPENVLVSRSSQSGVSDTTTTNLGDVLKLPHQFGLGAVYSRDRWRVGADYSLTKWGSVSFPTFTGGTYRMSDNYFKDRQKVTVGGEYLPPRFTRNFFARMSYRFGASYASPYYKINGADGPREVSVSAGFGVPIVNNYNRRSYLNISGQWVNRNAKGMIKENCFMLNIGITFNEQWFSKWKAD